MGDVFENQIADLLQQEGWTILHRNIHNKYGELDIVIQKEDVVGIVEVKGRNQQSEWNDEIISKSKRDKLIRCSNLFLSEWNFHFEEVIFVVAVIEGEEIVIIWDAFEADSMQQGDG